MGIQSIALLIGTTDTFLYCPEWQPLTYIVNLALRTLFRSHENSWSLAMTSLTLFKQLIFICVSSGKKSRGIHVQLTPPSLSHAASLLILLLLLLLDRENFPMPWYYWGSIRDNELFYRCTVYCHCHDYVQLGILPWQNNDKFRRVNTVSVTNLSGSAKLSHGIFQTTRCRVK